jgi:hypothetical protein
LAAATRWHLASGRVIFVTSADDSQKTDVGVQLNTETEMPRASRQVYNRALFRAVNEQIAGLTSGAVGLMLVGGGALLRGLATCFRPPNGFGEALFGAGAGVQRACRDDGRGGCGAADDWPAPPPQRMAARVELDADMLRLHRDTLLRAGITRRGLITCTVGSGSEKVGFRRPGLT